MPFKENQKVDKPVSLYAATKISNELMAHSYSHLFDIPSTGLRFLLYMVHGEARYGTYDFYGCDL